MEIMLKNKYGFQVNISLSIFFIAFCDLFTGFPSYVESATHLVITQPVSINTLNQRREAVDFQVEKFFTYLVEEHHENSPSMAVKL
jgi:hypothetical protein